MSLTAFINCSNRPLPPPLPGVDDEDPPPPVAVADRGGVCGGIDCLPLVLEAAVVDKRAFELLCSSRDEKNMSAPSE